MTTVDQAFVKEAETLDASDSLSAVAASIEIPEGWIFFDANSVGPMPKAARASADQLIHDWAHLRRRGWSERDWVDMPSIIGDALAPMIGAGPGEVVACDNTTINLYKAVTHALALQPGRNIIITQETNFPTDLHVLQGIVRASQGRLTLLPVASEQAAIDALSDKIAMISVSHVDYRSGERWDMARVSKAAHDHGALTVWDVSHSAGAVPVDVRAANADYVVGCGYKYLCTGPGGPAYIYVRPDLTDQAWPVLCGWMGHADIFAFDGAFEPHKGIKRFLTGTPMVGANEIAAAGAAMWRKIDPQAVWSKHRSLSTFMTRLLEAECGALGVEVTSPQDYERRGGHISFRSPGAGSVVEALIDRKVVSSFRKPDVIRFGISPLALRHMDMIEAIVRLKAILQGEVWRDPKYAKVSV